MTTLPLMPTESLRWQPELAPEGPVSAVLSRQSGRIVVYRAGVEIGRARVVFHGAEPVGTHVLLLVEGAGADRAALQPEQRAASAGSRSKSPAMPTAPGRSRIRLSPLASRSRRSS